MVMGRYSMAKQIAKPSRRKKAKKVPHKKAKKKTYSSKYKLRARKP